MLEIFRTLSDQNRLRILSMLINGDMCVCEIEAGLKFTQSNASRHLIELKRTSILDSYKKAQWTYYTINKIFINDNQKLWEYIKEELKNLSTYEEDYRECLNFKTRGICGTENIH
ncbi:MAG: metalloregulator ArsR/SmtB family transcription factor [Clostridia bacterium]|nr:metalloregulator ArsR/SmtB family transcription factor [Clostridia bacterium]